MDEFSSIVTIKVAGVDLFRFIYHSGSQSLAKTRFTTFSRQIASGTLNPQMLPKTDGAANHHSLRAYLQLWDWIKLKCMYFNPVNYSWKLTKNGFEPNPTMDPIVPQELSNLHNKVQ